MSPEEERLHYKEASVRARVDTALRRLESVLHPHIRRRAARTGDLRGFPLATAFETVAAAAGIEVQAARLVYDTVGRERPVHALGRATHIGVRGVRLGENWWRQDGEPMIAYRSDGRPVALLPHGSHAWDLHDPVSGDSTRVSAAIAADLQERAYVLSRPLPRRKVTARDLVAIGVRGSRADLLIALAAGFLAGLLALLVPLVTELILDDVIPNAERDQLLQYTLLLMAAAVAATLFSYTESISLLRVRGKLDNRLQNALWERVLSLPMSFFRRFNAGDLANRALGVNAIGATLALATIKSVFAAVFSFLSLGLMFWYNWRLALIGAFLVTIGAGVLALLLWAQLGYERLLQTRVGIVAGQVLQLIGGIAKLRVAHAERPAFAFWAESYAEQKRLTLKAHSRANAFMVFSRAFMLFSTAVLLVGVAWFGRAMEAGTFAAFYAAFGQFAGGALGLLTSVNSAIAAIPLYERARPILETWPEIIEHPGDVGALEGRVELDQVVFRYESTAEPVLKRFSLAVASGEFVAIVGPSGAGKSTILRLMLGFESPESGTISYDRRNLAGLDLAALRRQIGVVLQDGRLFPGTVLENILGDREGDEDAAWQAARMAGLEDFIRSLPMGMQTIVSEGAGTFSGGQRQRLMIARAVVNRPRVLLFDEATSALDNRTQADVAEAVDALQATRVVIAHRLSTIRRADRIVVLDHGGVQEEGTYEELMAQGGLFAELARRQLA